MAPAARPYALGRRIVIWGATGAGKTTLGARLSGALDLHFVDLDAIRHANGWDSTSWEDFRTTLTRVLDEHPAGWVISGSYSRVFDAYLPRADTLIWLNLPWRVSYARLLRRTVRRAIDRGELYPGSPARESWRQSFLSRQSILLWSISHYRAQVTRSRERIGQLSPHVRVFELTSTREIDALARAAEVVRA
jgi:adenylate kinase family enzyme